VIGTHDSAAGREAASRGIPIALTSQNSGSADAAGEGVGGIAVDLRRSGLLEVGTNRTASCEQRTERCKARIRGLSGRTGSYETIRSRSAPGVPCWPRRQAALVSRIPVIQKRSQGVQAWLPVRTICFLFGFPPKPDAIDIIANSYCYVLVLVFLPRREGPMLGTLSRCS
jgi:hypothetical protein